MNSGFVLSTINREQTMPAFLPFKEIAQNIDVEQVATLLNLKLKRSNKELRAACPACGSDDERSLALMPETNSFRCYAAQLSGDCISLYAHLEGCGNYAAAKALQEHFLGARAAPATAPQAASRETTRPTKPPKEINSDKLGQTFDADAFAAKLTYTDEVAELGIAQEDAERLRIGYCTKGLMKGRVCIPVRTESGEISGFMGYAADGDPVLKLPQTWLPAKVVQLRKRAS